LRRKTHQTIKKVTEDLDGGFHFNTAISSIMELVNQMYDVLADEKTSYKSAVLTEAVQAVVMLLAPFVPHICEEMWRSLGHKESIFRCRWAEYDKQAIVEEIITVAIQINGKFRSRIEVPFGTSEEDLKKAALSDPNIEKWIQGRLAKEIIVVPKKLVNIVI
jgi:leucyl-tRNA synthetase